MTEATPTTPLVVAKVPTTSDSYIVKAATPQYVIMDNETLSPEIMTSLIFEDLGSQEIINIARNDTVFGEDLIYQLISNTVLISQNYNSKNIISLDGTSDSYFRNFSINFETKIPKVGSGTDGSVIYIDASTGDLVIEFINLENDEQVEVNVMTNGKGYYDTI